MNFELKLLKPSDFPQTPLYKDSKDISVFIVTKGSLIVDIAYEKRIVGAGKTFFIGPKMIFSAWPNHASLEGFKITIPAKEWKKIALKNYDFMLFPSAPLVKELISYPSRDNQFDEFIIPVFIKILENQMRDRCFPKGKSFKPLSFFVKPTTDSRIAKACKIISTQYNDEDLTMDSLAKKIGVSPRNMQRLFLSELGIKPIDALKRARIENALYLLLHSDSSLSEIGKSVGYQSHSQFVSAFKSLMGTTPSEVKR